MAHEVQLQTAPVQADATVYFLVFNEDGAVWSVSSSAFVTFADVSKPSYAVSTNELGTSSGYYSGDFPSGISAGTYNVVLYLRVGATPSVSDTPVGVIDAFRWDGSAEVEDATGDDLITLAFYKTYYGITSTENDPKLAEIITAASLDIVNFCGFPFKTTSYAEYYDCDRPTFELILKNRPLISLTQVTLDPYDVPEVVNGSEYILDKPSGIIRMKPQGSGTSVFGVGASWGFQSVLVEYTAGYATVPQDVKEDCAMLVKYRFDLANNDASLQSERLGDYSYTKVKSEGGIPEEIKAKLWKRGKKLFVV